MDPAESLPLLGGRVFVTGGSRGIGEAVVRRCAAAGARVVFCFRERSETATRLVLELRDSGADVSAIQLDLLDRDQVFEVFEELAAKGSFSGLVNNAGHMGRVPFREIAITEWKLMLDGNLTGTFNCIQAALPLLSKSPRASIVNVTSRLGQVGVPGFVHYAAAKAGLVGFTRALAAELAGEGIRVNAVAPGVVETDDRPELSDGERRRKLDDIPLGRFSTPDEIAGVVEFLLSSRSSQFIGQTLNPSGGAYMP